MSVAELPQAIPAELIEDIYRQHVASGDPLDVEILAAAGHTAEDFERHRGRRAERQRAFHQLKVDLPKMREEAEAAQAAADAEQRYGETVVPAGATVAEVAAMLARYHAVVASRAAPVGSGYVPVRTVAQARAKLLRESACSFRTGVIETLNATAGGRRELAELVQQKQRLMQAIMAHNPVDLAGMIEQARAEVLALVTKPSPQGRASWKEQLTAARARLADLERQHGEPEVAIDISHTQRQLAKVQEQIAALEQQRRDPEYMDWS